MDIIIKRVENGYLIVRSQFNIAMIGLEQTNTYIANDESEVLSKVSKLLNPLPTQTPIN
jgi:hypothetical protein